MMRGPRAGVPHRGSFDRQVEEAQRISRAFQAKFSKRQRGKAILMADVTATPEMVTDKGLDRVIIG